jgi:hypothetical protein
VKDGTADGQGCFKVTTCPCMATKSSQLSEAGEHLRRFTNFSSLQRKLLPDFS